MPAGGGDAAHLIGGLDRHPPVIGRHGAEGNHGHVEAFAFAQMEGDVAAIVDIGLVEVRRRQHVVEHLLGHRAGDRRHEGDEAAVGSEGADGGQHAPGNRAVHREPGGRAGLAQQREFRHQLIEDGGEAGDGCFVGTPTLTSLTPGLDDEVDGAVLQVQAASAGKEGCNGRGHGVPPPSCPQR